VSTERERLLIDAVAAFFREPESRDYWSRIRLWEQAMEKAYAALPRDTEVAAFYALAHLAAAPVDKVSRAHSDRAAEILLDIYRRNPEHPGAMHYLVHANDTPGRERELLEITRKYETVAPRNPHALHMPTHIYTRLGDWDAVIRGNLRAAAAALEHPAGDRGQFVWDEFPHAIEYLVYAHLQKGADAEAAAQMKRLLDTAALEPTFKTAYHLASIRARYALERQAWREAIALVPRDPPTLAWDRFLWPEAVTWFARGLGAAHEGSIDEARRSAGRLQELETAATNAREELFARNIRVLRLGVDAWIAHLSRDTEASLARMREATELELATPKHAVTPGPTLPAFELLGDLMLAQGNAAGALPAYERSLELYPRRLNSLLGAARASRAVGDESRSRTFYNDVLTIAGAGTRSAPVQEAQRYLSEKRAPSPRSSNANDSSPREVWQSATNIESLGWSRSGLALLEKKIAATGSAAFMIVTRGRIVAAWGDTTRTFWSHSVRKSLLSALIGQAVADGKIDTARTLAELGIDERATPLTTEERRARVIDLLQARSGVYLAAAGEVDAMRDARPQRGSHAPGTFWYYNNWDFNVLGTIYRKSTGEDLFQAFDRRIARPIGMQDYRAGEGVYTLEEPSEHPAFAFRISARDLARFGLLYLQRGKWASQQVIPEAWVDASVKSYSRTGSQGSRSSKSGYGYMWWIQVDAHAHPELRLPDGSFTASGNGGQRLTVIPQIDSLVVNLMNTDEPGPRIGSNEWDALLADVLAARRR
jgi:CubicO group peptidase (beta-lactamase class C family)